MEIQSHYILNRFAASQYLTAADAVAALQPFAGSVRALSLVASPQNLPVSEQRSWRTDLHKIILLFTHVKSLRLCVPKVPFRDLEAGGFGKSLVRLGLTDNEEVRSCLLLLVC